MTYRCLLVLIASCWLAETTMPARALSGPVAALAERAAGDPGAFILVRKGKGHGDRDEHFEHRHRTTGLSSHRRHWHGVRGFRGNLGNGNYRGFGSGNLNQPNGQN